MPQNETLRRTEETYFQHEKTFVLPQKRYWYHYDFIDQFRQHFPYPQLTNHYHEFPNDMPLPLINSSRETLLIQWVNDNWKQAIADITVIGHTLTYDGDRAGPNTERLGILFPSLDARQDQRTHKDIPGLRGKAVVRRQGVSADMIARVVGGVAQADYVITFDLHSHAARRSFEKYGVEVFNVLPLEMFATQMVKIWDISQPEIAKDTIIATTDFGSLNRALPYQRYIESVYKVKLPIVLLGKHRIARENGTESQTVHNLVCGDLQDKNVFMIDDSYAQGGSSKEAVELTLAHGAKEIIMAATHPIFVGGYYSTLSKVLEHPQVRAVMTTDSLPFEDRWSGGVSVPYFEDKKVMVLESAPFLAQVSQVVIDNSPEIAKEILGLQMFLPEKPSVLAKEVFNIDVEEPMEEGIYLEGNVIYTFDELQNNPLLIQQG